MSAVSFTGEPDCDEMDIGRSGPIYPASNRSRTFQLFLCELVIGIQPPAVHVVARGSFRPNVVLKVMTSTDAESPQESLRARLTYEPQILQFGTSGRRGEVVHLTQLEIYINALAELKYLKSLSPPEGGIREGEE